MLVSSVGGEGGQELAWHPEYIQRYLFRRCGHFVEFISMREFLRFWEEFMSMNLMGLSHTRLPNSTTGGLFRGNENLRGYNYSEGLLSLGIVDPMLRSNVIVPSINRLLMTNVPTVKQITVVDGPAEDSPVFDNENTNWNGAYQDLVSECCAEFTSEHSEDEMQTSTSAEILHGVSTGLHWSRYRVLLAHSRRGRQARLSMSTHYQTSSSQLGYYTPTHKEAPQMPKYQKADMEDMESVPEDTESEPSSLASSLNKAPISVTPQGLLQQAG